MHCHLADGIVLATMAPRPSAAERRQVDAWCEEVCAAAVRPIGGADESVLVGRLLHDRRVDLTTARRLADAARVRLSEMSGARVVQTAAIFGHGQEGRVAAIVRGLLSGGTVHASAADRIPLVALSRVVGAILAPDETQACDDWLEEREMIAILSDALSSTSGTEGPPTQLIIDMQEFARGFSAIDPPAFDPPVPVVIPPRPERPHDIANQLVDVLQSGQVKHGNRWTRQLEEQIAERLDLPSGQRLVVTNSGTSALRLAVAQIGDDRPRAAIVPAFTFAATGEFLTQLGYSLIFCDIDARTWTLDPESVRRVLRSTEVDLVVSVDALGNPANYDDLISVCDAAGVELVADSAPALGARYRGAAVGTQTRRHAFHSASRRSSRLVVAVDFLCVRRRRVWIALTTG